jgi:alkylated DNA repair dioxygenase AlkB
MDLFKPDPAENLLPCNGVVNYYGPIFSGEDSDRIFEGLFKEILWKNDEAFIFGKHYVTARKVAWYGDSGFHYSYSGATKFALDWTDELLKLKEIVEEKTGDDFNSCLLNLYHTGDEGMAWHSDDEKSLGRNSSIASLSFGAERPFRFKHKQTAEVILVMLDSGSLLVMKGETQTHWRHRLPKTKKVKTPRINLTFRKMIEGTVSES